MCQPAYSAARSIRAMRPPRRLARRGARAGNSAMISARASCVIRYQVEISSIER